MKYLIKEEFVLSGKTLKVGEVHELDHMMANLKSIQGKIELTTVVVAPKGEEVLATITPGVEMTEEQKKKLAEENARVTAEAHAQAAEHRAQDIAQGVGTPVVNEVADMLKDKLVGEEFLNSQPPTADSTPTPPENQPPNIPPAA